MEKERETKFVLAPALVQDEKITDYILHSYLFIFFFEIEIHKKGRNIVNSEIIVWFRHTFTYF